MLKDFLPPHIFRIEGQPAYFDPVRKKYVLVTPRETVRQRVVPYLIQELDVPQKMIRIGEKLSYYGLNFRHRADIVIEHFDAEENILRPLAASMKLSITRKNSAAPIAFSPTPKKFFASTSTRKIMLSLKACRLITR